MNRHSHQSTPCMQRIPWIWSSTCPQILTSSIQATSVKIPRLTFQKISPKTYKFRQFIASKIARKFCGSCCEFVQDIFLQDQVSSFVVCQLRQCNITITFWLKLARRHATICKYCRVVPTQFLTGNSRTFWSLCDNWASRYLCIHYTCTHVQLN